MTSKTRILFFDTGNYSRSPAAEVIANKIASDLGVSDHYDFWSAGMTEKHVGGPADPRTAEACAKKGYSLDGFVCRRADHTAFAEFDQILAMDKVNLAALELARRPGDHAKIDLLNPEAEIPDPFFGDQSGFEDVVEMIEKRLMTLLRP